MVTSTFISHISQSQNMWAKIKNEAGDAMEVLIALPLIISANLVYNDDAHVEGVRQPLELLGEGEQTRSSMQHISLGRSVVFCSHQARDTKRKMSNNVKEQCINS
jgi:hypothetical protein